jgi:hypothetical protein
MLNLEFSAILAERFALVDNDAWGLDAVWEKEISLLTRNMEDTIAYILTECTEEQLFWMSEVFEQIVQVTQSVAFLECLKERVKKVKNTEYQKEILKEIDFAEGYLE